MNRMQGKVVVVTGAAKGMGRSHALLMASEGARLVVADVDEVGVAAVVRDISDAGGTAMAVTLNVTDENQWVQVVERVVQAWGGIDVLVNNAGIIIYKEVIDTPLDEWRRVMDINATGAFLGCRAVGAAMKRQGHGAIVNVSSVLSQVGAPGVAAYQASKGAVTSLTKSAAVEFASFGVRVNAVHPGLVETPMIADFLGQPEAIDALLGPTLIRRLARPEEISQAVLLLASDESSYMTGTSLMVDGGFSAV